MDNKSSKIDWMKILQVVAQAIIAALTALGVSSCVSLLNLDNNDTRDLSHNCRRGRSTQ